MALTLDEISLDVMVNMLQFKHLQIMEVNFGTTTHGRAPIVLYYLSLLITITVFVISASDQMEEIQMVEFSGTLIYEKLENDLLPYGEFLMGDDAFHLKTYLLKPHSHKPLTLQ